MTEIVVDPAFLARRLAVIEEEEKDRAEIESRRARIDMSDTNRIRRLRRRASAAGLTVEKGRGGDNHDLGGLLLFRNVPPYRAIVGRHYSANLDDVEHAIEAYRQGRNT